MKYRIKIEESNNGEKWYTPQILKPLLKIGKFDFLSIGWYNIIEDSTSFWISSFAQTSHNTEQKALDVIEEYKKFLIEEEGEEIKKITYKTVE